MGSVYAGSYNRLLDARNNIFALKFAKFPKERAHCSHVHKSQNRQSV